MRVLTRITAAMLLVAAVPAFAGIADTPLPVLLTGAPTYHLYSVPGVIAGAYGLGTYFSSTSTDTATMQVGVEVFSAGAILVNDGAATSLSVAPGATVTFGTQTAAGLLVDSNLGAGFGGKGSARILATSKKLACTAFIADTFNAPPLTTWQLTIIAKTKQKAAN